MNKPAGSPDFLADVVEHQTKCPQCGATTELNHKTWFHRRRRGDNRDRPFAHGVLDANGNASVVRVQDEMLEGAESGIALARIGGFSCAAHVKDEARVGQVVGDVDDAL